MKYSETHDSRDRSATIHEAGTIDWFFEDSVLRVDSNIIFLRVSLVSMDTQAAEEAKKREKELAEDGHGRIMA